MSKYIHYGSKVFDKSKFVNISNWFIKPKGGLWGSRIDSKYGWKEWNDESEFTTCLKENSFEFSLSPGANVVELFTLEDLQKIPIRRKGAFADDIWLIDFEECVERGIDAIELMDIEKGLYYPLYGWDCECILILNPEIVEVSE